MKNIQNRLFIITILFFVVGMIHISFSLIGILCFTIPFIQYNHYKDKVWCKYVCPRAGYFNRVISKINIGLKPPKWFNKVGFKNAVLIYFGINLFFVTMSTIMVSIGRISPIDQIRFLIMFPWPVELPQLLNFEVPLNLLHFSYRIYSMMLTSVIIGSLLGIVYRPRTWCTICPVNTLTTKSKVTE